MNGIFEQTSGMRPGRTGFDLSHNKLFDADIGKLTPVLLTEVLPGDVFDLQNISLIRAQPLVTPIYHRLQATCHYYFVPNRIVMPDFEKFITGGRTGDESVTMPTIFSDAIDDLNVRVDRYGLWDYFGLPMHDPATGVPENSSIFTDPLPVMDLPWRVYWAIWRDYYRDSNIQTTYPNSSILCGETDEERLSNLDDFIREFTLDSMENICPCDIPAFRCFQKDIFTSALPFQQRGTAPVIPISGTSSASWTSSDFVASSPPGMPSVPEFENSSLDSRLFLPSGGTTNALDFFNGNTVNFTATGVNISDLRLAVQTQRFLEAAARGGYRYNEWIRGIFGVSPTDARLQRPEYIGGSKTPIIISEIIQNSESNTTPQGTLSGHGMAVSEGGAGRYRAEEHGFIIGILSIMPEAIYQQGIPRQLSKSSRYDYYNPAFAHLSEQEILKQELFFSRDGATTDETRFGFQAAFDEYRTMQSMVCGKLASDLTDWHLSRIFDSPPSLNEEFLTTQSLSENRRNSFAVPGCEANTQAEFLVQWRNVVRAVRPLPYISDPGLLDHV